VVGDPSLGELESCGRGEAFRCGRLEGREAFVGWDPFAELTGNELEMAFDVVSNIVELFTGLMEVLVGGGWRVEVGFGGMYEVEEVLGVGHD